MYTSLLLCGATILPLFARIAYAVPVVQSGPVPQALDPPKVSGIYPEPEKCSGVCASIHDPNIVYENDQYWRFTTSRNISIATAPSLEGPWTYQGSLLPNGSKIHLRNDQDIWAPSIFTRDGIWYCHYSVSYIGSQHSEIGVATSVSDAGIGPGAWEDHGSIGLPQNPRYNLIDPFVFWDSAKDPNGPAWLTFGSYWSGIQQIQMGGFHDLTAWKGKDDQIRNVLSNTTAAYAVQEGATYHREGKWIYAFFSVGQCCRRAHELMPPGDEYRVVVCRGESPTGPYHDKDGKDCLTENGGTTVLASHGDIYAPGGQGVMLDPKSGRTVMYYHYVRKSVGYEADDFFFGFNYLDWVDGWPVLVAGSPAPPHKEDPKVHT